MASASGELGVEVGLLGEELSYLFCVLQTGEPECSCYFRPSWPDGIAVGKQRGLLSEDPALVGAVGQGAQAGLAACPWGSLKVPEQARWACRNAPRNRGPCFGAFHKIS